MKTTKVAFIPNWSRDNPYLNLLSGSIRIFHYESIYIDYPKNRLPISSIAAKYKDIKIIHIHWLTPYTNIIANSNSNSKIKQALKIKIVALDIILAKLLGKKIVWTVHNLIEHESQDSVFERKIRSTIYKYANKTIFHSERNKEIFHKFITNELPRKSFVIPHGNYIDFYREANKSPTPPINNNYKLLFFGQIRKYKGIAEFAEKIAAIKNNKVELMITGKEVDTESGRIINNIKKIISS